MNCTPISIFLVKNGQGGDRVIFRYPFKVAAPKKLAASTSADFSAADTTADLSNLTIADPQLTSADPHRFSKYKLTDVILDSVDESTNNLQAENLPEYSSKAQWIILPVS